MLQKSSLDYNCFGYFHFLFGVESCKYNRNNFDIYRISCLFFT